MRDSTVLAGAGFREYRVAWDGARLTVEGAASELHPTPRQFLDLIQGEGDRRGQVVRAQMLDMSAASVASAVDEAVRVAGEMKARCRGQEDLTRREMEAIGSACAAAGAGAPICLYLGSEGSEVAAVAGVAGGGSPGEATVTVGEGEREWRFHDAVGEIEVRDTAAPGSRSGAVWVRTWEAHLRMPTATRLHIPKRVRHELWYDDVLTFTREGHAVLFLDVAVEFHRAARRAAPGGRPSRRLPERIVARRIGEAADGEEDRAGPARAAKIEISRSDQVFLAALCAPVFAHRGHRQYPAPTLMDLGASLPDADGGSADDRMTENRVKAAVARIWRTIVDQLEESERELGRDGEEAAGGAGREDVGGDEDGAERCLDVWLAALRGSAGEGRHKDSLALLAWRLYIQGRLDLPFGTDRRR